MSQDSIVRLIVRGPKQIITQIEALARSYGDGFYPVTTEIQPDNTQPNTANLSWGKIKPKMEIQATVEEIGHDGVWVTLGLPDNEKFLVVVPHVHQRRGINQGSHVLVKITAFNRDNKTIVLEYIPR